MWQFRAQTIRDIAIWGYLLCCRSSSAPSSQQSPISCSSWQVGPALRPDVISAKFPALSGQGLTVSLSLSPTSLLGSMFACVACVDGSTCVLAILRACLCRAPVRAACPAFSILVRDLRRWARPCLMRLAAIWAFPRRPF